MTFPYSSHLLVLGLLLIAAGTGCKKKSQSFTETETAGNASIGATDATGDTTHKPIPPGVETTGATPGAEKADATESKESPTVEIPPLTTAAAKALVPQASSISNADFKKLSGPEGNPTANGFESQSLSLVLMTLDPAKAGAKNPEIFNDFQYLPGFTLDRLGKAVTGTQAQGFVTLIQPQFITHGSCETDKDQARGFVTFHAKGLYSGKVHFQARYHEGTWRIEEFQLPVYGITVSLDKQGNWQRAVIADEPGTDSN